MSRSRSRRVVLLLDCCYAGAFERGIVARAGAGVDIEEQFGGRGRAVITASSAMEYAFEGDQLADTQALQPSVFTSALVQGLETGEADRDQDGMVDLDELYDYIYDKVRAVTPNQTPGKWTFAVQGELYIARRSQPVTTPAPLPPELQQVIEHPIPVIRAGAVQELERLLGGRHAGLALAARQMLEQLVDDDSRMVSAAATAALGAASEGVMEASERAQPDATEVSVPAASPSALLPQPPKTASPPISNAPIAPPGNASVTKEDKSRSIPGPAATPAQSTAPTHPSEPTLTKSDEASRGDATSAGPSSMQAPDRSTTEAAKPPATHEHKPPANSAGILPVTADKPEQTQPSPFWDIIGRHRGWALTFGIITLLVGLLTLIWPGKTVVVIAVLFGIRLVVAGIFRLVVALTSGDESGVTRVRLALLGVLSFIVGLYALLHIQVTLFGLTVLLGIFWIVNGAVEMFVTLSNRAMPGRGWTLSMGLLSVMAGVVVVLTYPVSLLSLAVMLGFWLLLVGIIEIVLAFQFHSAATHVASTTT